MFVDVLTYILSNFGFVMFDLAIFFIILHKLIVRNRLPESEMVYRWMAVFGLGFSLVYAGIMHIVFPEIVAQGIGWATSPFQFEVGMADIALGMLGIFSFRASYSFRVATVFASIIMLWGDALGHLYQQIVAHNFSPGNAGTWFWLDLIIPLVLLICIINLRPTRVKR